MNVLVIGGGGREHALAWKLGQSARVERVFCSPGNPGMRDTECIPGGTHPELAEFAKQHDVGLTVVGPEVPLCDGIVDVFRAQGLRIFGPTRDAARLEGSKDFAKRFMLRHGIPTARGEAFSEPGPAKDCLRTLGAPVVVKADGLAAGKGVTVATTTDEADRAVDRCFAGAFGNAGARVVIEECLVGEEASILALVDGNTVLPLASSQDHKRLLNDDQGPNTGGMGAYSPAPVVDKALWERVRQEILTPFQNAVRAENLDFRGVVYAGIMVTDQGPKVLEFNVRFGDPETQVILPRLQSDLADAMIHVADGRLANVTLEWRDEAAVVVVLASGGYPGAYETGFPIQGIEAAEHEGAVVFHAGTARDDSATLVTNGGRVLGVTTLGPDIRSAVDRCYHAVRKIHWPGMQYRTDIAQRALAR